MPERHCEGKFMSEHCEGKFMSEHLVSSSFKRCDSVSAIDVLYKHIRHKRVLVA